VTPPPPPAQSRPSVSRRSVLAGLAAGAAGTALAAVPVRLFDAVAAAAPAAAGVFGYGVASGDPTATSVILWTRATPSPDAVPGSGLGAPTTVGWEVARDAAFTLPVASGAVVTSPDSDHTVKVDVGGLTPYTRYYYRFSALGETSRVGRTQTAPDDGQPHALRLAFVSCSNYTGGYFTAYRGIAARDDLDVVLHLGDYIYEYGESAAAKDRYGPAALAGKRDGAPGGETITLADYRLRYALHKADADQALAHQRHPWITIFDDHEVCNNTWATDAENHDPSGDPDTGGPPEGDFLLRRARAYQAYLEWMPIRLPDQDQAVQPHAGTRFFRRFTYGGLADLSVLETRQNRSRQVESNGSKGGGFVPSGSAGLADANRHLPEPEQRAWLKAGMADGSRLWHLVGNQVVFAPNQLPGTVVGAPAAVNLVNSDAWDGYQFDRDDVVAHAASLPASAGDTVLMTGDIHSSWAIDVPRDTRTYNAVNNSVMVEFVGPSVTSDGFKEVFGGAAQGQAVADGIRLTNPWVKLLDGVGHGFCVLDVTPQRVQTDYWFIRSGGDKGTATDPRTDPAATVGFETAYQTLKGSRRITGPVAQLGPRSDSPTDASAGPAPAVPEHVGPAVVAGVLGAAALAWSRRASAAR